MALGSQVSLASLFTALFIACLVLALQRYRKGRRLRLGPLMRAVFPKRIVLSRSSFADLDHFYFNLFVFGLVLGWAVLSYDMISRAVVDLLAAAFGPVQPTSLPVFVSRTVITVMLFLAYELGYWLNHYLSHRIPFLWEFHKVHHSATVLTPLTNFRVHPVYMAYSPIFSPSSPGWRTASAITFSARVCRNTVCRKPTSSWSSSSTFTFTCSTRSCGSHSPGGWAIC